MRKFVKSCFIMLPLLLVSLFTLSCENILNNNRTSISFSIGEDAVSYIKDSCRTVNSFTEDTEIEVVCSLLKGERLALQESKKGPMKNVGDFFFRFYDIPFSNDYKVKVGFFYKDIITFYASSDTFGLSKGNIHPTINLTVEPVPQKITYNLDGGNISKECPKTYYINSNIRIPSPTKEGFTFSHWELDDGTKITVLGKDNFLGEVTLNAKWKEQVITPDTPLYKVTFVSNGHGTAPQSIELPKGSVIPVEKLAPLNAEGYTFAGWFKDDKTFNQEWNQSVDTVQTSPITLYAKWNINTYKITYETGVTQTVTQKTVTYGSKLEAIHLPSDLVKDKYDFTNWKYKGGSKDGNVAKIGDKVTEDITLVATWTLQGQVKNVEFNIATPTVDYGTSIVLTSEKGSTIYYTTDNLDPKTSSTKVTVSPNASGLTTSNPIVIEKETTIKAYATISGKIDSEVVGNTYKILTYTVSFDAKGHGTSPQSIELHKDSIIPTEKLAPLTADGYTFGGWFKDDNTFTQEWDPLVDTVQTSSITLYAKWDINTYNITYKNCDELSLTHNNKKTYTIEDNITLTDPLRTGYRFGGWYLSSDGTEPQYIEGNKITNIKGRTGDITLYAKWDVITYTITYETGVTQTVTAKSINHGSKLEASHLPTDLVRDKFTFENWKYSGGSKDGTVAKIGDIVTENITLTATWTPFGQTAEVVITGPDGNNVEKKGTDITLSCSTPGAQIYYTIDGSEPSTSLTPVLSPATITLTDAATVKAFATSDKNVQSATKEEVFVLKKYNVNFVTSYGSVPSVSLTEGSKIAEPSNLTQTGYTLSGWIKEKANPSDPDVLWNFSNDTMPGKDITLTAKWDVISYNITYNNCESIVGTNSNPATYDIKSDITLTDVQKTGYTFGGWYISSDGSEPQYIASNKITNIKDKTGDITLYAKWDINTYNITYKNCDELSLTHTNQKTYTVIDDITLTDPLRTGYRFGGWYISSDGSEPQYIDSNKITNIKGRSGDITLYAKWDIITYTITYETGVTDTIATKTVNYGTTLADTHLPTNITNPQNDLTNWKYKGGSKDGTVAKVGDIVTENITLTATWTPWTKLEDVKFSVPSGKVDAGDTITLSSVKGSTIYYTTDNSEPTDSPTRQEVAPNDLGNTEKTITITGDSHTTQIKAYATCPKKLDSNVVSNEYTIILYNVSLVANGHGKVAPPSVLPNGSKISSGFLAPLTADGYTFGGWFKDNNTFTQEWDPLVDTVQKSDVTLYAKWDINTYNITYKNCDELSLTHNNKKTYTIEDNITLTDPLRTGYRFGGWYISSDGSEPQYIEGNKITNIKGRTGDITLYAKWDVITYNITYNNCESIVGTNSNPATYDITSNITLADVQKKGYTFGGWYISSDGSEPEYIDSNKIPNIKDKTGNITLYAKWTANTYTVTFDPNGGTNTMGTQILTYDKSEALNINKFTRDGYIFNGWNIDKNPASQSTNIADKTNAAHNLSDVQDGNVTLYAQWERVYTVTFDNNGYGTPKKAITGLRSGDKVTLAQLQMDDTNCGATFNYWENAGSAVQADITVTTDITLQGNWTNIAPTAIEGLVVKGGYGTSNDGKVSVSITKPTYKDFDHMEVSYRVKGTPSFTKVNAPKGSISYNVTGLQQDKDYEVKVVNYDTANSKSADSAIKTVTTTEPMEIYDFMLPKVSLAKKGSKVAFRVYGKNFSSTRLPEISITPTTTSAITYKSPTEIVVNVDIPASEGDYTITVSNSKKTISKSAILHVKDYSTLHLTVGDLLMNDNTIKKPSTVPNYPDISSIQSQVVGVFYGCYGPYGAPLFFSTLPTSDIQLNFDSAGGTKYPTIVCDPTKESYCSQSQASFPTGSDKFGYDNYMEYCHFLGEEYDGLQNSPVYNYLATEIPNLLESMCNVTDPEVKEGWYLPTAYEIGEIHKRLYKNGAITDSNLQQALKYLNPPTRDELPFLTSSFCGDSQATDPNFEEMWLFKFLPSDGQFLRSRAFGSDETSGGYVRFIKEY